jgi:hypothetical protein
MSGKHREGGSPELKPLPELPEQDDPPTLSDIESSLSLLDQHILTVGTVWLNAKFVADKVVGPLDAFVAGWKACEDHYEGRA